MMRRTCAFANPLTGPSHPLDPGSSLLDSASSAPIISCFFPTRSALTAPDSNPPPLHHSSFDPLNKIPYFDTIMSRSVSPLIIAAREISVRYGEQVVLQDAALSVHEEDRIGLIGNNGSGKSTLLKILAGLMEPDLGSVERRKDLVTGYLSHDFQLDP